jgi:hypothetical protein
LSWRLLHEGIFGAASSLSYHCRSCAHNILFDLLLRGTTKEDGLAEATSTAAVELRSYL